MQIQSSAVVADCYLADNCNNLKQQKEVSEQLTNGMIVVPNKMHMHIVQSFFAVNLSMTIFKCTGKKRDTIVALLQ